MNVPVSIATFVRPVVISARGSAIRCARNYHRFHMPRTRDLVMRLEGTGGVAPCDFTPPGASCRALGHGEARSTHRSDDVACSGTAVAVGRFSADSHTKHWECAACAAHEAWSLGALVTYVLLILLNIGSSDQSAEVPRSGHRRRDR